MGSVHASKVEKHLNTRRTMVDNLHKKAKTEPIHIRTILYATKIKHDDRNKTIAEIVQNYIRTIERFDLS